MMDGIEDTDIDGMANHASSARISGAAVTTEALYDPAMDAAATMEGTDGWRFAARPLESSRALDFAVAFSSDRAAAEAVLVGDDNTMVAVLTERERFK